MLANRTKNKHRAAQSGGLKSMWDTQCCFAVPILYVNLFFSLSIVQLDVVLLLLFTFTTVKRSIICSL